MRRTVSALAVVVLSACSADQTSSSAPITSSTSTTVLAAASTTAVDDLEVALIAAVVTYGRSDLSDAEFDAAVEALRTACVRSVESVGYATGIAINTGRSDPLARSMQMACPAAWAAVEATGQVD